MFDGQVVVGKEELLAIHAMLDIFNGNASFSMLRPPLKIEYERNFYPDSSYANGYESLKNPKTGKMESYLSSVSGTTNFIPSKLGDT